MAFSGVRWVYPIQVFRFSDPEGIREFLAWMRLQQQ